MASYGGQAGDGLRAVRLGKVGSYCQFHKCRVIYFAKYYDGGGGMAAGGKKWKLRVWGKNEKKGKGKKEKKDLKTHI